MVVIRKKKQDTKSRLPVRANPDDGDSCHAVTMHDGVENRRWASPPWQQAGVNIQNPAEMKETDMQFIFRL